MNFIFGKKLLFLISIISVILIWNFNSDSKPQIEKHEKVFVKNETVEAQSNKEIPNDVKNIPPFIRDEYLKQKQKLQEEKVFHEKLLQSRKKYLESEQKKRAVYLKYKTKYTQSSSQQMKGKFDSVKKQKEKVYQKRFEQSNIAKRSQMHTQVQKRVELQNARLKSLQQMQEKKNLNQKYKQGE